MKFTITCLFALLSLSAQCSFAGEHLTIKCNSGEANCPEMPASPEVPLPPPASDKLEVPLPPPPPPEPKISEKAHAFCATQKEGTQVTWIIDGNSRLSGYCLKNGGKMGFHLELATVEKTR